MRRTVFFLTLVLVLASCRGSRPPAPTNLPVPTLSTTLGPGDVFTVIVVGEKDLPSEFRVQPDGSIDFPYVTRTIVAGLEPQQVVDLLRKKLADAKVLENPQISVFVKQYNSKKVSVIGQVQKPGTIAFTDGLRLVDAISQSGWFTPLADSNGVVITRQLHGKTVTAIVSVDAITDGEQADIPLQAGDTIKVDARVF